MDIHKAMAKASQGPMKAEYLICVGEERSQWIVSNKEGLVCHNMNQERDLTGGLGEAAANMALMAHWCNEGPKMLDALRQVQRMAQAPQSLDMLKVDAITSLAVTEAQEVQGI